MSLLPCATPPAAACESIEGREAVLAPGRVLLLGELHGTAESPAFAGDVACQAAKAGLDVVVALELPSSVRGDVETFLRSPGAPSDREALLSGPVWTRGYQDGRTSRAMVDLLGKIARLRREGHSVGAALFDARPRGGSQERDRAMAQNLASSVEASPGAMHIVLTGNVHSRITEGNQRSADYEPMGFLLSKQIGIERMIALNVSHAGGSAWLCAPACGVVHFGPRDAEPRWTIRIDDATRPAGHHGWYGVGTLTASPPAVGEHVVPAEPATGFSPVAPPSDPADSLAESTEEMLRPFQGSWQAWQYGSRAWTLDVDGERFRGVLGPDDWYEGTIRLRPDSNPAEIDFHIEDCRCAYRGQTSQGIFRLAGESIVLAAPQPGTVRPTEFDPDDGRTVELKRFGVEREGDEANP